MVVVNVNKNNTYSISDVFQWDKNRELVIYGLNFSYIPEIHFAKSDMTLAIVKQATIDENGNAHVEIPNVLLEKATPIKVYVCSYNGEEFISRYTFTINVKARVKPADYIAEDDEKIYSYNALENLVLNTIVELKEENEALKRNVIAEVTRIINDKTDSDTLDGFHALDFELSGRPGKTVFNSDGSITTTYDDGSVETVVFNADGSITTTSNILGLGVRTETTKFNADGSITVEVTVKEVE